MIGSLKWILLFNKNRSKQAIYIKNPAQRETSGSINNVATYKAFVYDVVDIF